MKVFKAYRSHNIKKEALKSRYILRSIFICDFRSSAYIERQIVVHKLDFILFFVIILGCIDFRALELG